MTAWPPGIDLVTYDSIDSTNLEARRRVDAGACGPIWLASHEQTKGRGRHGRNWTSPPGNLAATYLFPFRGGPAEAARLSFATALAVADTFAALAPEAKIGLKWPNDALLNGRKAAGILLENFGPVPGGSAVAIGIGLNLVHHPPEEDSNWPPTSVARETGRAPDFETALTLLAARMANWLDRQDRDGFAPIRAEWRRKRREDPWPI